MVTAVVACGRRWRRDDGGRISGCSRSRRRLREGGRSVVMRCCRVAGSVVGWLLCGLRRGG